MGDNNSTNHPNLFSGQSKRTVDTAKREGGPQILSFDRSCMLCAGAGTVQ